MVIIKRGANAPPPVSSPTVVDSDFSWMDVGRQTIMDSFSWQNAALIAAGVGATVLTGGAAAPALLPLIASEIAISTAITGAVNAGLEYADPNLIGVNSVQTETDKIRSAGGQASLTPHELVAPVPGIANATRTILKIGKAL